MAHFRGISIFSFVKALKFGVYDYGIIQVAQEISTNSSYDHILWNAFNQNRVVGFYMNSPRTIEDLSNRI